MILRVSVLLGAGLALLACAGVRAATLVPPPGFTAAVTTHGKDTRSCESPPKPFTGPLEFPSKYRQDVPSKDVIDPKAYARYKELIEPINAVEKNVSSMVGSYLHTGQKDTLDCVLGWLDAWARADALRGEAKNHTGKSVRKWTLASIASAWNRLKFSSSQPLKGRDEQVQRIEKWLGALGSQVVDDWKDQPKDKINNHQYWAAWATMADAVALNRRDLFDWSVDTFRFAARQIDDGGFLENELKRETRALSYHNYSLGPLVMIAAFAKANGVDLTGENHGALQRLAQRVLSGIDDPSLFEDKTGDEQSTEDLQGSSKFAWLEPYCWLYACDERVAGRIEELRPLKTYRLGGNLTDLFGAPGKVDTSRHASAR